VAPRPSPRNGECHQGKLDKVHHYGITPFFVDWLLTCQNNGGEIVPNSPFDTTIPRTQLLLLIPGSLEESPPCSGAGARLAHGVGQRGQLYGAIPRAASAWISNCVSAGRLVEHVDLLGIHGKRQNKKAKKYPGIDDLNTTTPRDQQRVYRILKFMDECLYDRASTRGVFYEMNDSREAREEQDRAGKLSLTCSFCDRYSAVFEDCSPAWAKLRRRGRGKSVEVGKKIESKGNPVKDAMGTTREEVLILIGLRNDLHSERQSKIPSLKTPMPEPRPKLGSISSILDAVRDIHDAGSGSTSRLEDSTNQLDESELASGADSFAKPMLDSHSNDSDRHLHVANDVTDAVESTKPTGSILVRSNQCLADSLPYPDHSVGVQREIDARILVSQSLMC
jgi:hypothetical protein